MVFPGANFGEARPGRMKEMTVPPDMRNDIREMEAAGVSRSEIARKLRLSRNTVAKYADMEDMSPAAPVVAERQHPAIDAYAEAIDSMLASDLGAPRRQRHTAKRIYDSFLERREDLVLMGDVETGKTHMASALCQLACDRRMEARFFTAPSLVMRLRRARDEGRLDREMAQVARARLLVAGELGFLPLDADGARLVFQVFADACERQSVVITTNLEFSRRGGVFGDDQMAAAVIDRIVHHGRLVQFRGESYRVKHALMQEG